LARAPKHAPAIGSGEQAAGTLYVLEGARLGGVLIADRLSKAGKPVGQPGFQFFGSAKAGIAERWRHFRAVIDSHDWSDKERERACVNAQATFMAISATLAEEQGHG
jgi:heme oxygenase